MREWLGRFVAAAGVAVVACLGMQLGVVADVRFAVADRMLRFASGYPPPVLEGYPHVLIVGIDSRSLKAFPADDELARKRLARTIRRLDEAGARVIAIDLDLSDVTEDRELARAIAQSGRVVLAARPVPLAQADPSGERTAPPHASLARGAAGIGASLPRVDSDGSVRRAFHMQDVGGKPHPSLVEAALEAALGTQSDGRDPQSFAIDYRRAAPRIPVLSALDAVEGRFNPGDVAGRIVFIGETAPERHDLWDTPLGPGRPAVWIHAVTWRTRLAQHAQANALYEASPQTQLALIALLSALGALLATTRLRWQLAGLSALALAVPSGALALLLTRGLLVDPVLSLFVVAAHGALGYPMVRRSLARKIREHELSLSRLFHTPPPQPGQPRDDLSESLLLLAEVSRASAVGLLRTNDNGELVRDSLAWRRSGEARAGDLDEATLVLADRSLRIFENRIPGRTRGQGAAIYAPLFCGNRPVGVLVVEQDTPFALGEAELRCLVAVGTQLALSIENLQRIAGMRRTHRATLTALANAIDARDGYTDTHCRRLALVVATIAERLGLPADEVDAIELGALLHDVGKIGISESILRKDGLRTQSERHDVEEHADIGQRIVTHIEGISAITVGCVRHHHERWNGTGYPDGLAGEAIPLGARIVALVDVWDALSSSRPYKRAYPQTRVREIIEKESGERFEPALVQLFFEVLDEQGDDMLDMIAADEASETSRSKE